MVVDHGRVIAVGSPRELTARGAGGTMRFNAPAGLDIASLAAVLPGGTEVREPIPGHYLVTGTVDPQPAGQRDRAGAPTATSCPRAWRSTGAPSRTCSST